MKILLPALLLAVAAPATAAVVTDTPTGFELEATRDIAVPPAVAYARLVAIGTWWADSHTYSGKAANMTLAAQPGGCFCEAWDGNAVEHGRVLTAMPGRLLRLQAALGPLQERPVAAVLEFIVKPQGGGTRITMRYRVAGPVAGLAAVVDKVMVLQMDRLAAAGA